MGRPKSDDKLVPVMVRLAATEVERIDAERGDRSRSDYVRSVLHPSSGGAEIQPTPTGPTGEDYPSPLSAPPDPPRNNTGPVPSLRQEASATFQSLHDAPEGIGAKWTVEEATYWENRSKREMDAWRAAHGIGFSRPGVAPPAPTEKPQRRQGTITRPADRAPKPPVKVNGAPVAGSLTRRTVTPMFKP